MQFTQDEVFATIGVLYMENQKLAAALAAQTETQEESDAAGGSPE